MKNVSRIERARERKARERTNERLHCCCCIVFIFWLRQINFAGSIHQGSMLWHCTLQLVQFACTHRNFGWAWNLNRKMKMMTTMKKWIFYKMYIVKSRNPCAMCNIDSEAKFLHAFNGIGICIYVCTDTTTTNTDWCSYPMLNSLIHINLLLPLWFSNGSWAVVVETDCVCVCNNGLQISKW